MTWADLGYSRQTKRYDKCWKCGVKFMGLWDRMIVLPRERMIHPGEKGDWLRAMMGEKVVRSGMLCIDAHERAMKGALPLWHHSCFESTPVNVVTQSYGTDHPEEFPY